MPKPAGPIWGRAGFLVGGNLFRPGVGLWLSRGGLRGLGRWRGGVVEREDCRMKRVMGVWLAGLLQWPIVLVGQRHGERD
jgi:hypothetical protein